VDPRRPRRWLWLLAALLVVAGLVALRLVTAEAVTMPDLAGDVVTLSLSVAIEAFPFVVLGVVLSTLVQVWIPQHWLERIVPQRGIPRRIVLSLLGFFLPVCECGNVPLSRGLMVRGLTPADSITFLLAAPILNPVTIITTQQAFGFDGGILAARLIGGFVIANVVGWLLSRHPDQDSLLTARFQDSCALDRREAEADRGAAAKFQRSATLSVRELGAMLPALLLGALLAGAIQVLIPREWLTALGANPVLSVLAMMALGFVVSICANVDAFFALSFASIFLPGSIAAFLVFGPMIDIKLLALLRTTFRVRTLVLMTVVVAALSFLLGVVMNLVGT